MRIGLGAGSGVVYDLLAQAGLAVLAVTKTVEARILEWPSGPSQEQVKDLEHETDRFTSELLGAANSLFVTPFDRDDRIDPVIVIRWKDIYEALEDADDACETAAHRVGNILVKNA